MNKKCLECWATISEAILNELVVIGLEMDQAKKRVLRLEKIINLKWQEVNKDAAEAEKD